MAVYQVAVLEEVPKLVRGMVKSSIRGSVPVADQGTFVMLFHDEAQWRQLAHYKNADDAYVVVLDRSGTTRFTVAGAVTDHYEDVVEAAKRVLQP
jgi:predicted transcriptional regulator